MTRPLTSLYLHFPFCRHLCNYCDFYKKIGDTSTDFSSFNEYLDNSFSIHQKLMKENSYSWSALNTLYLGGGTPSVWGWEGALFWKSFLAKHHLILQDCEFTMEANPGSLTKKILTSWMDVGVNRLSLGVQALRDDFLRILNRIHSLRETLDALDLLAASNVNFSVDFMLGLPFSPPWKRNITKELEQVLHYRPSHFSVYILTTHDNYIHKKALPDEEWIRREYLETSNLLQERGYVHYEVSNFAMPGKESRHNKNYWNLAPMGALGPSATGFLPGINQALRYKWKTNIAEPIPEILTEKQLQLERLYLALRTSDGLEYPKFFTCDLQKNIFLNLVSRWKQNNLAHLTSSKVTLLPKGYLLLDSLMDEIFREVEF